MREAIKENKLLILFDGYCNLCSGWAKFVLKHDKQNNFLFSTQQSDTGKRLLKNIREDTIVVIEGENIFTKSDAVFRIFSVIGYPWKLLLILKAVPKGIRDFIYDLIARRRYSIFGRSGECMVPADDVKQRFV